MSIVAIYGSSRDNGNSEQLTNLALKDLPANHIRLREKNILAIVDQRHDENGFTEVDDDYEEAALEMMRHKIIIFATPVYWYSMSGLMKNFVDRWSQSLRSKDYDFKQGMKDKEVYAILSGGPKVKIQGLPLVMQFKHICDFMGMQLAGYIIGRGPRPGEILNDEAAVAEANLLNSKLRQKISEVS